MNTLSFFEWQGRFDSYIGRTRNKRVVLLLDNASCHGSNTNTPVLSNVTVIFLPKRTTSRLQPMDAGVIADIKRRYRIRKYERALDLMEGDDTYKLYQVNVLTAIEWMHEIWNEIDSTTIHNCCCKTQQLQSEYQIVNISTDEQDTLFSFAEEDGCTSPVDIESLADRILYST